MIDTTLKIETPEGIFLTLQPAGLTVRLWAFAFDAVIKFAIWVVISIVIGLFFNTQFSQPIFLLLLFFMEWFYPIFFELYRDGATPGKSIMGLKVLNDNGTAVSVNGSVTRNFLRIADFFPLCYGIGTLSIFLDPKMRRLGDLAGGTLVVYDARKHNKKSHLTSSTTEEEVATNSNGLLRHNLSRSEKQAIVNFAERAPSLSKARQLEMADILEPLHGKTGEAALTELMDFARILRGES